MAIWPFIISRLSRQEIDASVILHEKIHFRQQLEMVFIPFFIWYFIEYLIHLIQKRDKNAAYLAISFEKEAYQNEDIVDYLNKRKFYSWTRFLK